MTKADIVEGVYERLGGFSKKEAASIVETIPFRPVWITDTVASYEFAA